VLAIAGAPAFAVAQDADSDARHMTRTADHEDTSDWGWLGLLGLVGLRLAAQSFRPSKTECTRRGALTSTFLTG
jgi:hypothetical protein